MPADEAKEIEIKRQEAQKLIDQQVEAAKAELE